MPQPVVITTSVTATVRNVGDLITLGKMLADLGVHEATPMVDGDVVIDFELPIKDWSMSKGDALAREQAYLTLTVDHQRPAAVR